MAAQYGMVSFIAQGGRSYNVDVYCDDSAGDPVRWDGGAGASATSPTFWTAPENVMMTDVVLAAATAQTKTQVNRNNVGTGHILRNSVVLASVNTRPALRIPFGAGSQVSLTQLA